MEQKLEEMVSLWADHFRYTREFVFATVYNRFAKEVGARLFQNQADLGTNLAYFYGLENGDRYYDLLHEHIAIASDIVGSAIKGKDIAELNQKWEENALEIAFFLFKLLGGDLATFEDLMLNHLKTTLAEAVDIIKKRDAIASGDIASDHVMMMANDIANIIRSNQ